jgi:NitT/TauT family transport system substrate-binding protein
LKIRHIILLIILLFIVLGIGLLFHFSFSLCHGHSKPLLIGTCDWPGYEPLHLAMEKKYISKSSARIIEYPTSDGTILGLRNDVIDIGALTLDEAIDLKSTGVDLKIILVMDISNGGDAIIAKPGIKKIIDLKGKRVGVETTTIGKYFLAMALKTAGLKLSDITIVHVPVTEGIRAFKNNKIDAIATYEPVKSKLIKLGYIKIFDSKKIPNTILDVLAVKSELLKTRKAELKNILAGWFMALDNIKNSPDESISIMANQENIPVNMFKISLEGIILPDLAKNLSLFSRTPSKLFLIAQQIKKFLLEEKLIKKDPNLSCLFNDSILMEMKR